MIKKENLYAETVITESPFYYDEHGRLRARVLTEEQSLNELSMRGPENAQMTYFSPNSPEVKKDDEEAKLRAEFEKEDEGTMYNTRRYENPADHPKERKYAQWKQDRKNKQGALTPMPEKQPGVPTKTDMPLPPIPVRGGPAKQKPGLGKIIGGIKRPGIGGIKRPGMDSGNKPRIGAMPRIIDLPKPGIGGIARPMPAVPPSGKLPNMRIDLPRTGRPVLGGIDIDRGNTPPVPPTRAPGSPGMGIGRPSGPPSGIVKIDQGRPSNEGRGVARPAVEPRRPAAGKPLRSFRFSSQSQMGAGRNTNTRAGLRGGRMGMEAMEEQALPATEYLEIYEESAVQNQQAQTMTVSPESENKSNTAPAANTAATQTPAKTPTKAPMSKEESRARVQKRTQELMDLRKNNPEGYKAEVERINKVNTENKAKRAAALEKMKTANPAKYERVMQKDAERAKTIEGKKAERAKYVEKVKADYQKKKETRKAELDKQAAVRQKERADFAELKRTNRPEWRKQVLAKIQASRAKKAAKNSSGQGATNLQEKINLKTAEMGDVIRDFQKSDAPQFKGKSKEKRRMMAIAAKLQADRG